MSIIPFTRTVLLIGGIACCLYAQNVSAQSGGYEGLIAPAIPESAAGTDGSNAGYEGTLAPAEAPTGAEAPGYAGLLPGKTEEQMTLIPGTGDGKPRSSQDLRTLSMIHGADKDGDGVHDDMIEPRMVEGADEVTVIDGKTAMESMVSQSIEAMVPEVLDEGLTPQERAQKGREAYVRMAEMAEGLQAKKEVPEEIYVKMGLSQEYIRQERESLNNSLADVEKAMAYLKRYQ